MTSPLSAAQRLLPSAKIERKSALGHEQTLALGAQSARSGHSSRVYLEIWERLQRRGAVQWLLIWFLA